MGMGVCVLMTLSFVSFYKYIDCDRLKFSYQVHCGYKVLWSACVCAIRDCLSASIFSKTYVQASAISLWNPTSFFRPHTFLSSLSCIWFLVTGVFFMLLLPLFRCFLKYALTVWLLWITVVQFLDCCMALILSEAFVVNYYCEMVVKL